MHFWCFNRLSKPFSSFMPRIFNRNLIKRMIRRKNQILSGNKKNNNKVFLFFKFNFSHINSIIPITPENSSSQKDEIDPSLPENEKKFVKFAEKHRAVLNQILRQSNVPLSDGPFAVLTKEYVYSDTIFIS